MKTICALAASLALTGAIFAADLEPGFKSLFNGKDLTGWEGNPKLWSVQDGTITGITPPSDADPKRGAITHNTFLVYKGGDVADFELRLSYRIVAGNSGIQYRSKALAPGEWGPIIGGYQADFEAGKTYSGILYEERGRGILAKRGEKTIIRPADAAAAETKGKKGPPVKVEVVGSVGKSEDIQAKIKDEGWNDYVIIAKGNHLQHFINGQQTVDVVDEDAARAAKSGVLALQIHQGPPMTVQFRDVRIKNLGAGAGLNGKWRAVEARANGEALPKELLDTISLTIEGNLFKTTVGEQEDKGEFVLDETKAPKTMDVTSNRNPDNPRKIPAIYELSGDTLRVCYALNRGGRPEAFTADPESGRVVVTYQRQ